jgi:hypothetical protein
MASKWLPVQPLTDRGRRGSKMWEGQDIILLFLLHFIVLGGHTDIERQGFG